jgi:misacylated tRNA(Ala) deacylase
MGEGFSVSADQEVDPMTVALYYEDAYLADFDAEVVAVDGDRIRLDRTAFYPGGGGQPADTGVLGFRGEQARVVASSKDEAGIWHRVEGPPPPTGERVAGRVDWERRLQLMRTHTAMHILCGVIWRDHKASVTGGQMAPLQGRMDFEFPSMRQELVRSIEQAINVEVQAARGVSSRVLPREQAFAIPDLIRTKINLLPEGIQEVRIVEIEGLDLQADGGTHVANTQEVGPLRIVDYKSKGAANKRLVLALGA